MNEDLTDLIREARRELRKASGIPLSVDQQEEEVRTAQIEELDSFLLRALGIKIGLQLRYTTEWINGSAAAALEVGDTPFRIRKAGPSYLLNIVDGNTEREVIALEADDPQFANRLLVAIGDYLDSTNL